MRHIRFSAAALVAFSVFACSSSSQDDSQPDGDNADTGTEQDITSARNNLEGSWTVADESKDLSSTVAYELRPNGDFWRDDNRILNGVLVKGAPQPVARTSGTYVINTVNHTITLHVTSPIKATEVVAFEYTPGRVLNGVFKPGSEPDTRASLTLTQQPAPMSHVAYPAIKFMHADSWCTSDGDCQDEAKDKSWAEGDGAKSVSCDTNTRICNATVTCGSTSCGAGLVCCNALMGICTRPGEFCIQ